MPYSSEGIGYQGPETSRKAAEGIVPKAVTIKIQVYFFLLGAGSPLTSEEIAEGLALDYRSVQPRLSELQNDGHVEDSGIRRMGSRGKEVVAWRISRAQND